MTQKKLNLLFAGQDLKFMKEIIHFFKEDSQFIVEVDEWSGHTRHDEGKSRKLLKWADIIIAEWCLGNAVWYSKHKQPHQKLFIRFHRHEMNTTYPEQLHLRNVDKIVFIAPAIKSLIESRLALPKEKSILIYNAVPVKKFNLQKQPNANYQIGMIGYSPKLKRPDRAFALLNELKKYDERYRLHIKGAHPSTYPWLWRNPSERQYYDQLFHEIKSSGHNDSLLFEQWGTDIPEWLQKIGFILSVSDIEGSHQAVAEGMASGSIPFITGWKGSEEIYPQKFIKSSLEEMAAGINDYTKNSQLYFDEQRAVKEFCENNFDLAVIYTKWRELISSN
ncbi:glycosyltransferase involved in cell wall biosynthesis [Cytobacillus eiseniae]|uniref:Glycosyltransferase involved in cell wall biosynthesis n=1 Tax=Cytobacillus eiseniae TaxID=762947 RepID=A0ABS4RD27_9BACI|nr:glycosyltransferase family 4 protein [Cytobacillus eiseniae]MBP2240285.1 glycosyltransferase involved in cell wall biosynthesis [Cytobacillus eiseniae]